MAPDSQGTGNISNLGVNSGRIRHWVPIIIIIGSINVMLVYWWSVTTDQIARENGPVENLQLAVLVMAMAVFIHAGRRPGGASRQFFMAAGIVCLYLFLRELDLRSVPVSEWVRWLGGNIPRKVIQGTVLLTLAFYLSRHFSTVFGAVRGAGIKQMWPYALIFLLFCTAKMAEEISRADKNKFGDFALPHGQFWEEMLELNAHLMIVAVAMISSWLGRGFSKPRTGKHTG